MKKSLAERLSNAETYPETTRRGCKLTCEMDEGLPKEFKKAKVWMEEHPEGADRGGYIFIVKLGKEKAEYHEPDGWVV